MQFSILVTLLAVLAATPSGKANPRSPQANSVPQITIYDPAAGHIWNRLHAILFVRDDLPGTELVPDALDPPFWSHTNYLLTQPSHQKILAILDEFLKTHAENLIHDPVKRAFLQRDLWSVFDWSGSRAPGYETERRELQVRLAEVLHRLALTPDEIQSLPDTYAEALASGRFSSEYDSQHRDPPFLPPDLFDAQGSWVKLDGLGKPLPLAEQHEAFFSARSTFLIFLRLPGGRKATFDYLKNLWNAPVRSVRNPQFSPVDDETPNPDLPELPAGSECALVRQLTLFDSHGKLSATPITESVQIRVYRSVIPSSGPAVGIDQTVMKSGQDFYAIRLNRQSLFAHQSGGLKAAGPEERDFALFGGGGPDEGSPAHYASLASYHPVVKACVTCHRAVGLQSLNVRARLLKPNPLQQEVLPANAQPLWWQDERIFTWKQGQENWRLLNAYLKTAQ